MSKPVIAAFVIPAKVGIFFIPPFGKKQEIPTFAGMTY